MKNDLDKWLSRPFGTDAHWCVRFEVKCPGSIMWDSKTKSHVQRQFTRTMRVFEDVERSQAIRLARRAIKRVFGRTIISLLDAWRPEDRIKQPKVRRTFSVTPIKTPEFLPGAVVILKKRSRNGVKNHAYTPDMTGRTCCGFALRSGDEVTEENATQKDVACVMCCAWMKKRGIE